MEAAEDEKSGQRDEEIQERANEREREKKVKNEREREYKKEI